MTDTSSLGVRAELGKVLSTEHADLLREAVAMILREVMEIEASQLAGADRYERTDERASYRNGYRSRRFDTRVGTLELEIPKLRSGPSYLPSFLEARKRSEQALLAVVMEAYVNGVSTRKVERLAGQLGIEGISKSAVSRICAGLDERAAAFRGRPLEGAYPYVWLDARIERVRDTEAHTVRHKALLVAYGVHQSGRREVIGIDVGEVESEATWREFIRGLVARGLTGVQLVISDAHPGLKNAITSVIGAQWQRCCVHFVRDMLGHVPRQSHPLVRGALKQVFAAVDRDMAAQVAGGVIAQLRGVAPKVARLLEDAEEDLLAYMRFPRDHWPKIRSTNPLERVNREIARRSDVVGIYPNDDALIRLAAGVLVEVNDEWLVAHRYISQASMQLILPEPQEDPGAEQPVLKGALADAEMSTT